MRLCDWCCQEMGVSRVILHIGKETKLVFHGEKELGCFKQYRSFQDDIRKTKSQLMSGALTGMNKHPET